MDRIIFRDDIQEIFGEIYLFYHKRCVIVCFINIIMYGNNSTFICFVIICYACEYSYERFQCDALLNNFAVLCYENVRFGMKTSTFSRRKIFGCFFFHLRFLKITSTLRKRCVSITFYRQNFLLFSERFIQIGFAKTISIYNTKENTRNLVL